MNLQVLKYVIENEHEHLLEAVKDSGTSLDAAVGVAKLLIANNGDLSILKGKQVYVYENCIAPIFEVPCNGVIGPVEDGSACNGSGIVDGASLLGCYIGDEFVFQICQYDAERMRNS